MLDGVEKVYVGGVRAVADVSLTVESGEFLVLVGPSGCGKSTLLRMIAGLEEVTAGSIFIGGRNVTEDRPGSRDIAMVFQSYALYPHMTVRDNLGYGLRVRKTSKEEVRRRVEEAARLLGLEELLDRKPAALSGGQRQRVAMGRAIVREPQAFLMDEPLSNLDAKLRVSMRAELSRLHERIGVTTVYVTHDQTEAMTLGDRVAVMRAGIIQQVAPPATLYEDPVNLFVAGFIGSPSMNFVPARIDGDTLQLPFGSTTVPENLRASLQAGRGAGGAREVIAGIRPEHFEDATIEPEGPERMKFRATIDVVESMGSELYAYFDIDSDTEIRSEDLTELAKDAGMEDLSTGQHVVARLDSESAAKAGGEIELTLDTTQIKLFDPDGGRSLLHPDGNGTGARAAGAGASA